MADATNRLPQPDLASQGPRAESADGPAGRQRLLVVSPPAGQSKESLPVTSLASVFARFAEVQLLVGDRVVALQDSVQQQGRQLADVNEQLPDMKERINWLIASYYEDDRKDGALRERLTRQEAGLATLTDAVRGLCEAQAEWKHTMDQLLQILGRVQTPLVPAPPRWPE